MKKVKHILLFIATLIVSSAAAQDTARRYDAFFLEAICQQEKGNHDAAFDLLTHCVEIDSTRSEAFFYLARYYDYLKNKTHFFDSTPGRFVVFFPSDWHIAKVQTKKKDQTIRVIVIKVDYM